MCPTTWDGWQCWPNGGNPGRIEFRPCPSYIYFHSESKGNGEFTDTCGSKLKNQVELWFIVSATFNSTLQK